MEFHNFVFHDAKERKAAQLGDYYIEIEDYYNSNQELEPNALVEFDNFVNNTVGRYGC